MTCVTYSPRFMTAMIRPRLRYHDALGEAALHGITEGRLLNMREYRRRLSWPPPLSGSDVDGSAKVPISCQEKRRSFPHVLSPRRKWFPHKLDFSFSLCIHGTKAHPGDRIKQPRLPWRLMKVLLWERSKEEKSQYVSTNLILVKFTTPLKDSSRSRF